ncbi:MAG: DMT family transporter [Cereibacter sp.]|jgi:drug/metabolite transporter (DMT)-like permease
MDFRAIAMGLAFSAMWSSAFTSARLIVMDAPPLTALAIRFLISGLIGLGLALLLGQKARLSRAQWRSVVIFGICQNALYLGFNFVAMTRIEAGLASIIASMMPLMVALLGWIVFGEKVRPLGVAGLCAGFLGAAIIMGSRLSGGVDGVGVILCLLGMGALAVATLSVRSATSGGNLLMIVGLQMLVGSAALALPALTLETWAVNWTPRLGLAFAFTTLVPGLLATWVWFRLVGRIGAVRAATFHFLNPVIGVSTGALFLGERLAPLDLLGVAIIAGGILAVQWSRGAAPAPGSGADRATDQAA